MLNTILLRILDPVFIHHTNNKIIIDKVEDTFKAPVCLSFPKSTFLEAVKLLVKILAVNHPSLLSLGHARPILVEGMKRIL